jgi:FecR protein/Putative zinc-finger
MKRDLLDQVIAEIRAEQIDPMVVETAAEHVRRHVLAPAGEDSGLHLIRGCSDFQSMLPAYLTGEVSEPRRLLLEDHIFSCVACRHALDAARTGKTRTLPRPHLTEKRLSPQWKWAVAASLTILTGILGWNLYSSLIPAPGSRAVVKRVSGTLFAVAGSGSAPIFAGRQIGEHQPVRTFESSDAVLRLTDGSEVEMNARSEVWLSRISYDTTIHLTRGSIIVHAAKQRHGALHVATADCQVSVKGTIFAVTEGLKGARVSVVQGAVQVKQGSTTTLLHPGEQLTTSSAVAKTPVRDEVSWSHDSAEYLSLLSEFSTMAKQLAEVPQPGLRYTSKLADLAPPNTVLYAAIPNIGSLLSDANRIFNERLSESPLLAKWWSEHHPQDGPTLDDVVQQVRAFSDYLSDEIAVAVTMDRNSKSATPLVMAQVTRPGLADFLKSQAIRINSGAAKPGLIVLDNLADAPTDETQHMLVYVSSGYLFISPSIESLKQADAAVQGTGPRGGYGLYAQVQESYHGGAGWLLAADMEQIRSTSVTANGGTDEPALLSEGKTQRDAMNRQMAASGLDSLNAVVLERKDINGETRSQAALSFSGERSGMAGWMGAPGAIGALDFISPDASMVAASTIKDHGGILWDILHSAEGDDPSVSKHIQEFRDNRGWTIVNSLANSLGGDFAFALDGPVVPIPSWKLAIEVYNPSATQWGIEQLIEGLNQQPDAKVQLQLAKTEVNGQVFYTVSTSSAPVTLHYVYVDNYLLAAASQDLLVQAIQNRETGYTLAHAASFREQLPKDGSLDVSALLYVNVAPLLNTLSKTAGVTNAVSPEQKKAIASLAGAAHPGLVYAYAEPDRILVSSTGGFFGLNLDMLSIPAILKGGMHQQLMASVARK